MALKDWKKTISGLNYIKFRKKGIGNNDGIDINRVGPAGNWLVLIGSVGSFSKINKEFKTKSKALAYARVYMRKH